MRSLRLWVVLGSLSAIACSSDDDGGGGGFGAAPGAGGVAAGSGGDTSGGTGGDTMMGSGGMPDGSGGMPGGSGGSGGAGPMCCASADCQPEAVTQCLCVEWQQATCCDTNWDTFCQVTAEEKCSAEPCTVGVNQKGPCDEPGSVAGCNDPATEQCVCELVPDCCTDAWDAVCAQLVNEYHCQEGVRSCVCEEWEQATCCDTEWTDFCTITAEEKCGAVP